MIIESGVTKAGGVVHQYLHTRCPQFWVVGLATRGALKIQVGNKSIICKAPFIVYSRPGVRYEIASVAPHDYESNYAIFQPASGWGKTLNLPETLPGYGHVLLKEHPYLDEIIKSFKDMHRWTRLSGPNSDELAMNALERTFLLVGGFQTESAVNHYGSFKVVCDYILSNMDEVITVDILADLTDWSPSRFAHLFKDTFNCSPMKYVEKMRMEEAKALLASTNLLVGEVALRVGFPNQFHFSSRFQKIVNCSPSSYRSNIIGQ